MAWQDEAVPLLRILIGDDGDTTVYCETRLVDILVGAAKLVSMELSFDNDYSVTLSTSTISPDPSEDLYFIPLICLRAAYAIASSEYREKSLSNVTITDGPSTISLTGIVQGLKERMARLLDDYTQAKLQYAMGNAIGCQAVSTPTTYLGSVYQYYQDRRNIY